MMLAICLLPVFGIGLPFVVFYLYEAWSASLTVSPDRIIYESGLFWKKRYQLPRSAITDVKVQRSFLQKRLRSGQLSIYNQDGYLVVLARNVMHPGSLRHRLLRNRREPQAVPAFQARQYSRERGRMAA